MNQWIDITKIKPEIDQGCLVCAEVKGKIIIAAAKVSDIHKDGSIWWNGCGFGGYDCEFDFHDSDVTHWMPLPKPPELIIEVKTE